MIKIIKVIQKEIKKIIIDGFKSIKDKEELTYQMKVDLISTLFGMGSLVGILPGWRPKYISHNALLLFIENNFKFPKGLERAHEFHRRETFSELLNRDWLDDDEWWSFFYERDFTTLSTRKENRDEKNFNLIKKYHIPLDLKLFLPKRVGFFYGDKEKEFLKQLAKKSNIFVG